MRIRWWVPGGRKLTTVFNECGDHPFPSPYEHVRIFRPQQITITGLILLLEVAIDMSDVKGKGTVQCLMSCLPVWERIKLNKEFWIISAGALICFQLIINGKGAASFPEQPPCSQIKSSARTSLKRQSSLNQPARRAANAASEALHFVGYTRTQNTRIESDVWRVDLWLLDLYLYL